MIKVTPGDGPWVIDRRLPPIFERAPGVWSLVADGETPMRFATWESAEAFLRKRLDDDEIASYDWVILPEASTK